MGARSLACREAKREVEGLRSPSVNVLDEAVSAGEGKDIVGGRDRPRGVSRFTMHVDACFTRESVRSYSSIVALRP